MNERELIFGVPILAGVANGGAWVWENLPEESKEDLLHIIIGLLIFRTIW